MLRCVALTSDVAKSHLVPQQKPRHRTERGTPPRYTPL